MQSATELRRYETPLDYTADRERIKRFLLFFNSAGANRYLEALRNLSTSASTTSSAFLFLSLEDVSLFDETGLAQRMAQHAYSYTRLASSVVDELLSEDLSESNADPLIRQRLIRLKDRLQEKNVLDVLPGPLLFNYTLCLVPSARSTAVLGVRSVSSEHIGQLVAVRGIVVKSSPAGPSMRVATYICSSCSSETYQVVESDTFSFLEECASEKCRQRSTRGTLNLLARSSRFSKIQRVVIQEVSSDTPRGCVPRSMAVECSNGVAGLLRPGEAVVLGGIFLPRAPTGFRRLRAGLLNDAFLHCTCILESSSGSSLGASERGLRSPTQAGAVSDCDGDRDMNDGTQRAAVFEPANFGLAGKITLDALVSSLAPEIYGMEDAKRAVLLLLAGAPALEQADGMRVRGEINVLLLGDPGIAKSQILKTAARIATRGVYVTGRGSSGVGLTASVERDKHGEFLLDGGALVLADNGVCCIDELDKMDESDRVAIHETMEQQTVTVAKAGINATLNARCAVLAAANPVRGRYSHKKTIEQNVGLPISLVSRFDLVVVLRDAADAAHDAALAQHVTSIHCAVSANTAANSSNHVSEKSNDHSAFLFNALKQHLASCRRVKPKLPERLRNRLVEAYLQLRTPKSRKAPVATPRALLALIRIVMAHARLRLSETVEEEDVEDAIAIVERTRELAAVPAAEDNSSFSVRQDILSFVRNLSRVSDDGRRVVALTELWARSRWPSETVEEVLKIYEGVGAWLRTEDELMFLD